MSNKSSSGKEIVESILEDIGNKKISDISEGTISKGKQFVDRFLEVYGDIPISDKRDDSAVCRSSKRLRIIRSLRFLLSRFQTVLQQILGI